MGYHLVFQRMAFHNVESERGRVVKSFLVINRFCCFLEALYCFPLLGESLNGKYGGQQYLGISEVGWDNVGEIINRLFEKPAAPPHQMQQGLHPIEIRQEAEMSQL